MWSIIDEIKGRAIGPKLLFKDSLFLKIKIIVIRGTILSLNFSYWFQYWYSEPKIEAFMFCRENWEKIDKPDASLSFRIKFKVSWKKSLGYLGRTLNL